MLKPGEKVFVLLPAEVNDSILISNQGPFKIVKKITTVDYTVNVHEKHKVYHINMLKHVIERS